LEIEQLILEAMRIASVKIYGTQIAVDVVKDCEELAVGAEARLYRCTVLGVIKVREPKPFMMQHIDAKLRARRTKVEARALLDAMKLGIRVPHVLWVDTDRGLLVMEFVEGRVLREALRDACDRDACRYLEILGEYLAKLHSAGIVHGDPTTSNLILSPSGELYLIDFGLAEYTSLIDDYAIDIHIAFRAIESTHFDRESVLKKCLVDGYSRYMSNASVVLRKVSEIRSMGRYVERRRRSVWGEMVEDSVRY